MIRLTERYYDTHVHGYLSKPLFLNKDGIASVRQTDDPYETHSIVYTMFGQTYTVLESAETVAAMCEKEAE